MKRKLAILGTAIMTAAAITACGGNDTKTTKPTEVTTEAEITTTTGTDTEAATETGTDAAGHGTAADTTSAADIESTDASDGAVTDAAALQEAEDVSHAGAELAQSEIKPFAEKVQKAVAKKDMEALEALCAYPLYVSLGEGQGNEIADKDAFMKLDADKIFTEAMLKEIADTDVDTLEQFGVGVIMGTENNIIFNNANGKPGITGINLE